MHELIEAFTIERIGKAGARFDIHKAQWFNQHYLRAKTDEELAGYLLASLQNENRTCEPDRAHKIARAMRDRITFPGDIWANGKFFFVSPTSYDEQIVSKKWNEDAVKVLSAFRTELLKLSSIQGEEAKALLEQVTTSLGIKTGQILQALRMSLTGGASGPDLMMTIEILGPAETAGRLEHALNSLKVKVA